MSEREPPISDQILDLLLDALQARQEARAAPVERVKFPGEAKVLLEKAAEEAAPPEPKEGIEAPETELVGAVEASVSESMAAEPGPALGGRTLAAAAETGEEPVAEEVPGADIASFHLNRLMSRLFVVVAVMIVIINIPFNRYGTSLARAMPDSAALIIRNGLLLKGSGEKVYVLEDNKRRWITTLDAFERYGYRWEGVHQVEDEFLDDFEEGLPVHLLLKCDNSPHIYALEDGKKRWIKDIPTFEKQQYVWEDVQFVSCSYLRNLGDGPSIPEDAGEPPQPLP